MYPLTIQSVFQKLLSWELVYCSSLFKTARVESLQVSHQCRTPERVLWCPSQGCTEPLRGGADVAGVVGGMCRVAPLHPTEPTALSSSFSSNGDGKWGLNRVNP